MNKKPKNEKGFSAIEVVIVFVIVILVGAVGYIVYEDQQSTLPTAPYSSSDVSKWLPYTDNEGGFSAYFPTSPNYSKTPAAPTSYVSVNIGGVNTPAKVVESSNGGSHSSYGVIYFTFPSTAKIPNLNERFANEVNVHIISSKNTLVDGKDAERYEITATIKSSTINIRGRSMVLPSEEISEYGEFILDGKLLYNVYAIHHPSSTIAYYAKYFVNSFKLISPKE